jgi:hypothetical protein
MTETPTPMKAIRAKCLDCMCGQANEVKLCPITDCSLHPFRLGKNPNKNRNLTPEQRAVLSERAKRHGFGRKQGDSTLDCEA